MPFDLPPPPPAIVRELGQQQPLPQIPRTDLVVEVVGDLPVRTRLLDVTRLLTLRQRANSTRRYPPTILELITLVERNPARPPRRNWDSVNSLNIGYDAVTKEVIVEYCLEHCGFDPKTSALHPQRRMASYRAPESKVVERVTKKLGSLQKFADRPTTPK